jgi:hypothetical protein
VPADGPPTDRIARDPTTRVTRDPRFGPSVVPEEPPTLRISRSARTPPPERAGPAADGDDQLTIPLDGEGFEKL